MNADGFESPFEFENEVRRLARQMWPEAEYCGATMEGGRERDGVFVTQDCVHLIEATTSRRKDKAVEDIHKLQSLYVKMLHRYPDKAVTCWFITLDEPTAEQRDAVRKAKGHKVNVLSFAQFKDRLINAASYLDLRENYPFGSIRNPNTGEYEPGVKYVNLSLIEQASKRCLTLDDIVSRLAQGILFVILGDYGAGKSMTLREVYRSLKRDYQRNRSSSFPVYVNLRDHHGQKDACEVLERHARRIGFPWPSHLVRAWRAGRCTLMLDGFDEVGSLGIQGAWRKLREARFRSVEAVRQFVRETPAKSGLILAGREHFFDSAKERRDSLCLQKSHVEISLNDFTDEQVSSYMESSGYSGEVPKWMPSRPLLVGYLVSRGLLGGSFGDDRVVHAAQPSDPCIGWDSLVERIAYREAEIETGIDGPTVRQILERIATLARVSHDGLGPVTADEIIAAFKSVCGYAPDAHAMVLLQRLPGLGIHSSSEGSRAFIDQDLADVCRAGDICGCVGDPYNFDFTVFTDAECGLQTLGVDVAALRLERSQCTEKKLNAALEYIAKSPVPSQSLLLSDLLRVLLSLRFSVTSHVFVRNVLIGDLRLSQDMGDLSKVHFQDCYFRCLEIDTGVDTRLLPKFGRCLFMEVEGPVSQHDLPRDVFDAECSFESFSDAAATTDGILDLGLPAGVRVVLTILKKVYLQRGAGRRENALARGLDHGIRRLVPDALQMLQQEGLLTLYRRKDAKVWQPVRGMLPRASRMLASPTSCDDMVLHRAAELG